MPKPIPATPSTTTAAINALSIGLRFTTTTASDATVPEVADGDMQPSTESLARWVFEHLSPAVPAPARLDAVLVFESPDLGARYPA